MLPHLYFPFAGEWLQNQMNREQLKIKHTFGKIKHLFLLNINFDTEEWSKIFVKH